MLYFFICFFVIFLVLILLAKVLKFTLKTIIKLILNILIGLLVIWLLNYIPGVDIPFNWWSGLIVGVLGIPGAIIMLIVSFFI